MMTCEDVNICEASAPFFVLEPGMEIIQFDSLFCVPASGIVIPVGGHPTEASTNCAIGSNCVNSANAIAYASTRGQQDRCAYTTHRCTPASPTPPTRRFKSSCLFKRVDTSTSSGLMCCVMPASTRQSCSICANDGTDNIGGKGGHHGSIICETLFQENLATKKRKISTTSFNLSPSNTESEDDDIFSYSSSSMVSNPASIDSNSNLTTPTERAKKYSLSNLSQEELALRKKAQNRIAAQRYRSKKTQSLDSGRTEISFLEARNAELLKQQSELDAEIQKLKEILVGNLQKSS